MGINKKDSNGIQGSIFEFLSTVFKKNSVQAVLVGGYALNVNNVQRMTFDIDFMITASDCSKIEQDFLKAGYSVFSRQDSFLQFRGEKPGLRDIDLLICDEHTLHQLITGGREVTIAKERFIVASVNHLIAMKLHAIAENQERELKDFPDIVELIAANNIDPAENNIKMMFQKYKLMNLYKKVIRREGM